MRVNTYHKYLVYTMATVQDCNGWIGNIIRDKRIFFQNVGVDNPLTWLMS